MNGLEQTFYIMAIVYMAIMFILMVAVIAAIFAIKAKINAIHDKIESRLSPILSAVHAGGEIAKAAKNAIKKR